MITISEEWKVVDQWWTSSPDMKWYREVIWDGRILIFCKTFPYNVWRIVSGEGRTQTTSSQSSQ